MTSQFDRQLLEEFIAYTPISLLIEIWQSSSANMKRFLNSHEVIRILNERYGRNERTFERLVFNLGSSGSPAERSVISETCPLTNAADFCLRGAAEQDSLDLTRLFLVQGAEDISGALCKAAETGSVRLIETFADKATKDMYSMAAAHAALRGHFELTVRLYRSGTETVDNLNSILFMAVEGGHVEIIRWAITQGAHGENIPGGLIGKNIADVEQLLDEFGIGKTEASLYLFGAASFGTEEDIEYVLNMFPYLSETENTIKQAFIGALENNNRVGVLYLERLLPSSLDGETAERFLTAAACGNNLKYVTKYIHKAKKSTSALRAAAYNGNVEMINFIFANRKITRIDDILLYAAYSGSSEVIGIFSEDPDLKQLAYGSAAGGNWNYLMTYLGELETESQSQKGFHKILTQVFAELINHSQLSLFEALYSHMKDRITEGRLSEDDLYNILDDTRRKETLLTAIRKRNIHPAMLRRLDEVLGY